MKAPPIDVLLSWPTPNYDDPARDGPAATIVSVVLVALVTVLLAIRVYTRKFITNGFGLDDILILVAYVPALGFTATGLVAQEHFGWGTAVWDVPPDRFPGSLKSALASYVFFDLATSLIKLSMLALIYRLACSASKTLKVVVVGFMAFIAVNCLCFLLVLVLQCRPLHLYWEISYSDQGCIDEATHLLVAGVINTSTDLLVVLLPLALIHRLQGADRKLSPRQALIVNVLFALGLLATAAGAARTYVTWAMTTDEKHDRTGRAGLAWLASTIELYVGIMAASAPATKPFFARYLPAVLGTVSSSKGETKGESSVGDSAAATRGSRPGHLKRDSLSTIQEVDEEPVVFMRPVEIAEAKRVTFYDVGRPVPWDGATGAEAYSFPIRLDIRGEAGRERPGSGGSDTGRNLTEGRSFV